MVNFKMASLCLFILLTLELAEAADSKEDMLEISCYDMYNSLSNFKSLVSQSTGKFQSAGNDVNYFFISNELPSGLTLICSNRKLETHGELRLDSGDEVILILPDDSIYKFSADNED